MADEVVRASAGLGDDPLGFVPGAAGVQHRFADPAEEEGPPQGRVRLPGQQVAVKLAIGRRKMVEDQVDDRPGLVGVAKGGGRAGQGRADGRAAGRGSAR